MVRARIRKNALKRHAGLNKPPHYRAGFRAWRFGTLGFGSRFRIIRWVLDVTLDQHPAA